MLFLLYLKLCFDKLSMFHRYGLGAAVLSNDLERCDRVSKVRHIVNQRAFWKSNNKAHPMWTVLFLLFLAGFWRWHCMDQLFTAMLHSSSLGRQETQWFWPWIRWMVSLLFSKHKIQLLLSWSSINWTHSNVNSICIYYSYRGLESYLSVKQVTQYISDEPWGWYQSPSKL